VRIGSFESDESIANGMAVKMPSKTAKDGSDESGAPVFRLLLDLIEIVKRKDGAPDFGRRRHRKQRVGKPLNDTQ
jgi:hypothetical protein